MKKTLLAAAVASTVTSFAMADISITGDAKFEYDHYDTGSATSSSTNTEMHLNVVGKQGDTQVVIKTEIVSHGKSNGATGGIDVEDTYITTKVGPISVKAGNYASGTSGLLGEIENGPRATNKVTLSGSLGGVGLYAGNSTPSGTAGAADTTINNNMFAGAKFAVAGQNIEVKKNSDTKDSWGIKGSVSGVNYRYEASDDDTDGDTSYVEVSTQLAGVTVQYAALDADAHAALEENDSSVFAQEAANSLGTPKKQSQVALSTAVDGTKLTLKSGTIEDGISSGVDQDYIMLSASRPLASGATLVVTYNDNDTSASASKENLEVELNVKF